MNPDSILDLTKKALGIHPSATAFDPELIMHINSVFGVLHQIGAGPSNEWFSIDDSTATWRDFFGEVPNMNMIKTYMYLKVRLLFDPPATSFALESFQQNIEQLEWRIMVQMDTYRLTNPVVIPTDPVEPDPDNADALELLKEHLEDPTPHPVYDELSDGRFSTFLQNGMS